MLEKIQIIIIKIIIIYLNNFQKIIWKINKYINLNSGRKIEQCLASIETSRPAWVNFKTDSFAIIDFDFPTCFFWNKNWRFKFETSMVSRSITVKSVNPKNGLIYWKLFILTAKGHMNYKFQLKTGCKIFGNFKRVENIS